MPLLAFLTISVKIKEQTIYWDMEVGSYEITGIFIAHGSPLLAMEDNEYTRFLERLGQDLERPRGLLFSRHTGTVLSSSLR